LSPTPSSQATNTAVCPERYVGLEKTTGNSLDSHLSLSCTEQLCPS
jgi:hypothetical protein